MQVVCPKSGVLRLLFAYSRSIQASSPTRNATPAMIGTVSIRMIPKFGIISPYMIGSYSTMPETIAKTTKPTASISKLRAAIDNFFRLGFCGAALSPGTFSCGAGIVDSLCLRRPAGKTNPDQRGQDRHHTRAAFAHLVAASLSGGASNGGGKVTVTVLSPSVAQARGGMRHSRQA